jgi:type IV pilus assembly protein PilC
LKKRSNKLKQAWDKLILALPIVGQLIEKALLIRLSRTLSLMLNAGMPLSQAIPLLSRTFNNQVYQFAMAKSLEQLKQGRPFYQALQQSGRFPTLLIQMLQIGEESGKLECMLDKAANLYQEELDHAVDMLKELLEPCMMALLGLIVGSLVIAIYLPIFNLAGVL